MACAGILPSVAHSGDNPRWRVRRRPVAREALTCTMRTLMGRWRHVQAVWRGAFPPRLPKTVADIADWFGRYCLMARDGTIWRATGESAGGVGINWRTSGCASWAAMKFDRRRQVAVPLIWRDPSQGPQPRPGYGYQDGRRRPETAIQPLAGSPPHNAHAGPWAAGNGAPQRVQGDGLEHPGMLCSPSRNRNGRKADGVFGSQRAY